MSLNIRTCAPAQSSSGKNAPRFPVNPDKAPPAAKNKTIGVIITIQQANMPNFIVLLCTTGPFGSLDCLLVSAACPGDEVRDNIN